MMDILRAGELARHRHISGISPSDLLMRHCDRVRHVRQPSCSTSMSKYQLRSLATSVPNMAHCGRVSKILLIDGSSHLASSVGCPVPGIHCR